MTKRLVIANWKMNPESLSEAKALFFKVNTHAKKLRRTTVVICPPALYISALSAKKSKIFLGAQNVFWKVNGAHTGEIGASQLREAGAKFVIIGHSERRALGETDGDVSRKARAALSFSLVPIICVGESERDSHGAFLGALERQIRGSLSGIPKANFSEIILAYEPLWAIGKGVSYAMSARTLHETVIFLRKVLTSICGRNIADRVAILYGGSVDPKNAEELVADGNVRGFLVGGASLVAKKFTEILDIVDDL